MKKFFKSIILAVIAIAAIVYALSYGFSGLAWFPGFFVAVLCCIKIMDVNGIGQNKEKSTR